jgi:hypothetical protein
MPEWPGKAKSKSAESYHSKSLPWSRFRVLHRTTKSNSEQSTEYLSADLFRLPVIRGSLLVEAMHDDDNDAHRDLQVVAPTTSLTYTEFSARHTCTQGPPSR